MMALAPRFRSREHFAPPKQYRLAPFRFARLDEARYVATNDVGEHVVLSRAELVSLVDRSLEHSSDPYRRLKARHFLFDDISDSTLDLLALKIRTRAARIAEFTGLHIFVVTLRCDHTCQYCQVSRQTEDRAAFDMQSRHADRALEMTFRTPARHVKIEFQGGEPLLCFDLVRYVVERAEAMNREAGKDLQFVIASNLSRLTDDVLAFCRGHGILLSTSLDGPRDLHDAQRHKSRASSYELAVAGIRAARAVLGHDKVSALMTTTPASLPRVEEIIDEYARLEFSSIFLRSLSPYGFAARGSEARYDPSAWLSFYRRGLAHIIALNQRGIRMREEYTTILLEKLLLPSGSRYVDLQSPAGLGIGALVFNYDGAVYASDEGRMLAEMNDHSFRLGHLDSHSYESMLTGEALLAPLEDSLLESSPMCCDCPFLPCCGADPVFHKATAGDFVGHKAFSAFCAKQMGALRHLVTLLEDDGAARRVLEGWA